MEFEELRLCLVKKFVFVFKNLSLGIERKSNFLVFSKSKTCLVVEMKKSCARNREKNIEICCY